MDYEFARELKEKGFPQKTAEYWMCHDGERPYLIHPEWDTRTVEAYRKGYPLSEIVARPTLSELIEACGERFSCVHRRPDATWRSGLIDEQDKYICGDGSTPEEAVARLWLALHAGDASA